jgi:eukaryotic-like serine/threonine-protein kinase
LRDANVRATALFEEALQLAPDNPTVLSGYALAKLRRFALDMDDRVAADEAGEVGRKAAERALALAPQMGEPRAALAAMHWALAEWNAAAKMVREALALSPSNPDLFDLYGQMLAEVGKLDAALAVIRTASSLEPHNTRLLVDMARVKALGGDWSGYDAMIAAAPTDPSSLNGYFWGAARLMLWRKDQLRASELLQATEGLTFDLRDRVRQIANLVLVGSAYQEQVMEELKRWTVVNSRARRRPIFFHQVAAEAQAFVGNADGVLEMVESADSLGLLDKAWMDACPLLEPYRRESRFRAASARVSERAAEVVRILGTSEFAKR